MKKILNLLFALLLLAAPAWGATYYVDLACPTAGNGTSASCLSSPTTNNPKITIPDGVTLLTVAGDILNIRGVHAAHDSNNCPGSTTGKYQTNKIVVNKDGADGNPIIIQSNGWTGAGTGEKAVIEGTATVTWTQCTYDGSLCDCGPSTLNQTIGAGGSTPCTETWWVTGTGNYNLAMRAVNSDGSPTRAVAAAADMTNTQGSYISGRCSTETWRPCSAAPDCPLGGSCAAGATPEHDSFSGYGAGGDLLVRWNLTPGADNGVMNNADGVGFDLPGSSFVTINGIIFRDFRRTSIGTSTTTNIVVNDCKMLFTFDPTNHSGYGIWYDAMQVGELTNSEIAWTSDEGIHTTAHATASAYTFTNNWIHDNGRTDVIGIAGGTPTGMICSQSNEGSGTGPGDYTGSTFQGNLVENQVSGGSAARGIIWESNCNNWTVRDNIIRNTPGSCMKFAPDLTQTTSGFDIFNNLLLSCGDHAIEYSGDTNTAISTNDIYNNTCVAAGTDCIGPNGSFVGAFATNVIRNNIFYNSGSQKVVNWTNTTGSNLLEYNLIETTADPAITWLNVNRSCADVDLAGTGNLECPDPVFVSASDFHIQTSSPAKDAGTATGMPAGRTTDITNTLAALHGLPDYNDADAIQGGIWDMGADEFTTASPPDERKRRLLLKVGGKK